MEIFLLPIFFQYFNFKKDFIKCLEKKSEFSKMIFCTKNLKNFFSNKNLTFFLTFEILFFEKLNSRLYFLIF